MRRKLYDRLKEWKDRSQGRSAILIDGARRVGKSYIVRQFAENEYRSFIFIDFGSASENIKALFNEYLDDLDTFFLYLTNYTGIKLYPRESLIVFDEVQLFPRARMAIKYLVADGRYDCIETGSLVSINRNVRNILVPSEEHHLKMYPMDFEEFLWAVGNEMLMDFIRKCFNERKPLGQAMHRKAMDYFRQYMIVGGMPQAVQCFVDTHNFDEVDSVKRQILELYRADISKYATGLESKVRSVFDEIPSQLQKHEKKFKVSALKEGARRRDYDTAFFWLADAMIINNCYNTTEPNVGLKLKQDNASLKCYMADTGLLISHAFDENGIVTNELYKKLLLDKLDVNQGMIAENMVAQMLKHDNRTLYFYSNSSPNNADDRMEIDFLIAKSTITSKHNISPIEVKSGKRYTLNSMRKCLDKFGDYLYTPFVIHAADYREEDGITYLPFYMTMLL